MLATRRLDGRSALTVGRILRRGVGGWQVFSEHPREAEMAKTRKRTEVTVETETHVVLRRGSGALRAWCEGCGAESLMLTPREAAILAGVTTRHIYARAEEGA